MSDKQEEEELKPLNKKQKAFCREYVFDWNAARAARATGYSEKTAKEIGCNLLTKVNIQAYIEECKQKTEELAGVSKLRAIKELSKFAFTNFEDIHDTWFERKDFDELSSEVKACIQEIDTKVLQKNIGSKEEPEIIDVEYVKIKLVDKRGAIQDLSKMLGWNQPDKIDHTSQGDKIQPQIIISHNDKDINLKT